MKKILITGVAGFIGYSLAEKLLNKGFKVYGVDNFDNYYSIIYKKLRIRELKKNKKFVFKKIDITNNIKLNSYLSKINFDYIFHFAAQAGVRYSLINPHKYIQTNIVGFFNMMEIFKNKKIKRFFYASSSSVYGDSDKFPLKENEKINPKNIYGFSKKLNESIAEFYSKQYSMNLTGLRFFTVYGEWGRPDMFLFKLFKAIKRKKKFYLNNHGNHKRDFTYIKDLVDILFRLMSKKDKRHNIYNLSSNNPVNIQKIINDFKSTNNFDLVSVDRHIADVLHTHGSNKKILKKTNKKKIVKSDIAIKNTFKWYNKNNIFKIS
jgi:UDP-glucuronate 4-epimerase